MSKHLLLLLLLLPVLPGLSCGGESPPPADSAPLLRGADHHMHINSETSTAAWAELCSRIPEACGDNELPEPTKIETIVELLDEAGLEKGVVMSLSYFFGAPELKGTRFDNLEVVRQENQYVADQVARYPDRLVGMFSLNPVADYAVDEVRYWVQRDDLVGLKLHMANSSVDLRDPEQLARVQAVFAVLNEHEFPVAIHLRNRNPDFGAEDARIFIQQVLVGAPAVPVQLAHLGGWGGYDPPTDGVVRTFLDAFEAGTIDRRRISFDVAAVALEMIPDEALGPVGDRLREIGLDRIIFGSDWSATESPAAHIEAVRVRFGLSDEEMDQILANQADYLK